MIKIKGLTLPVVSISLSLEGTTKEALVNELLDKLQSQVFQNSYFLIEADDTVDKDTLEYVKNILENKNIKSIKTIDTKSVIPTTKSPQKRLMIVNKNLRSGQYIEHNGDVLVLGDVNEGASVVAAGNIVVMGALRGVAHAGAIGDDSCVIVAKKMIPQQIRIGHFIAIRSEADEEPQEAEVAKIVDNNIILEPVGGVNG